MAKPSFQRLGTSIDVPNVQALAASIANPADVPPRYVRPEAKADPVVSDGDSELPVIDFSRLLHRGFSREESAKLHHACADWGFFQLINHGVPDQAMEKMKADIKASAQLPNSLEGYGQVFVVSDDQVLDWADMMYLITRPLQSRNIDLWPAQPLTFRDSLSCYSMELKSVAGTLLEVMAKNLGVAPEEFSTIFQDEPQGVRINYYPPCPRADEVLGLSPHTDGSGLTLLLQVTDVEGLQIRKGGNWFPEERLSIATFHGPREDSVVGGCVFARALREMAKPSFQRLGTSIDVPNVQALAASIANPAHVPPRYVRPEAKADPVASDGDSELPVIDFSRLLHRGFSREESAKLHHACADWGFFQLINHGVPDQAMEKMKADIVEFFKLPLEEKKAFAQLPNSLEGYGQAFVVSDDQKLDWADMMYLITRPLQSRNVDLWPSQPLTFRNFAGGDGEESGVAPEEFSTIFQDQPQGVTDVEGLQIRKGGNWFPEERLSIATFHGPREDLMIGPLAEIVKGCKPKYVSMSYEEFTKFLFSAKLDGRRLMESLKL
ncbi:S-norcoclaurine synthase 1 [Musa troglodytarum]|uniref:S-norcoclaurine synthase 1 n=1 Tax=Musa troglodytarum TaxID=320322 RepID=A0A9E7JI79_9LILI|nr:S-norcoclaurine synthase 1 [Musa troglodytarum]